MTFYNNKVHCWSAETAEYGYDDIHSCCHHYGYGNFASQLRTLAGKYERSPKSVPARGHLRENISDVDDDKDYLDSILVQVNYQQRNGSAHNTLYWVQSNYRVQIQSTSKLCSDLIHSLSL